MHKLNSILVIFKLIVTIQDHTRHSYIQDRGFVINFLPFYNIIDRCDCDINIEFIDVRNE